MKKYITILFFFLNALPFFLNAQISTMEDKRKLFKADKAFDLADYFSAMMLYKEVYILDSSDNEINYKLGVCLFHLKKFRNQSYDYFNKVNHEDFPETDYYMGVLNHLKRDFEAAIFCFNRYKTVKLREHTTKEVDDLLNKCNTAILLESITNTRVQIANMGKVINTEYDEYAPLIPAEEHFMLFTSRRENSVHPAKDMLGEYYEDIYITKKEENNWSAPQIMDSTFNTELHDAGTGLSANGEQLLIYRTSSNYVSGNIFESFYEGGSWTIPVKLGDNVNSPDNVESSACYSHLGDMIFFASDRSGGFGGKDIYMAKKLPNGKWGEPFNLGPNVNTEYDEDAPFVNALGNTLYFSSQGHRNMGGFDIFKVQFNDYGHFAIPENMGYPVNTVDDDIFFVLNPDGSKGYLSSARDGGFGGQDIYSVTFPIERVPLDVYNLYVVDEYNNIIKDVDLEIVDLKTNSDYGDYKSNERTGKILFISEPKKEYRVTVTAEGYETFVTNVVFYSHNREKLFTLKEIDH